jgi:hypothetical protein
MDYPDHISERLETVFGSKYLNSLMRIRDPEWKKFGSGIRDKQPGSATLMRTILFTFFLLNRGRDIVKF